MLAHSFDPSLTSIFDIWNALFPDVKIFRKRRPNCMKTSNHKLFTSSDDEEDEKKLVRAVAYTKQSSLKSEDTAAVNATAAVISLDLPSESQEVKIETPIVQKSYKVEDCILPVAPNTYSATSEASNYAARLQFNQSTTYIS